MIRTVVVAVAFALGISAVIAQSDPIAERQGLMKAQGAATRMAVAMAKGEDPFDLARAKKVFETYLVTTGRFADLFPEGSGAGDTKAGPAIFSDREGFRTAIAGLDADAKAGLEATKDLDTFRAAFGKAAMNCQACHEKFRL